LILLDFDWFPELNGPTYIHIFPHLYVIWILCLE
jgi:hypothetical protein